MQEIVEVLNYDNINTAWKELLKRNCGKIHELVIDETFVQKLANQTHERYPAITQVQAGHLKSLLDQHKPMSQIASHLLDCLEKRSDHAFRGFVHVLLRTQHDLLAELFDKKYCEIYRQQLDTEYLADKMKGVSLKEAEFAEIADWSSSENILNLGNTLFDISVNAAPESVVKQYADHSEVYSFKGHGTNRGRCFVINISQFDGDQVDRDSSDKDASTSTMLFQQLGFECALSLTYLTEQGLLKQCDDWVSAIPKDCPCCVVFLMSHGESDGVFCTSDNKKIDLKVIYEKFNKCKNLIEKPKIFFVQACRGDKQDSGEIAEGGLDETPKVNGKEGGGGEPSKYKEAPPPSTAATASTNACGDNVDANMDNTPIVPHYSDTLICYATQQEFIAWRHRNYGSWFIRAIVEVFKTRSHRQNINDMLTKVNSVVSKMKTKDGSFKQQPVAHSSLNKSLYFFPKVTL